MENGEAYLHREIYELCFLDILRTFDKIYL